MGHRSKWPQSHLCFTESYCKTYYIVALGRASRDLLLCPPVLFASILSSSSRSSTLAMELESPGDASFIPARQEWRPGHLSVSGTMSMTHCFPLITCSHLLSMNVLGWECDPGCPASHKAEGRPWPKPACRPLPGLQFEQQVPHTLSLMFP